MIDVESCWIKANHSFYDVSEGTKIRWKGNYHEDLYDLSKAFFVCAYETTKDIVEDIHNNTKYDMWFLPSIYMFRQSIELLLKALLARHMAKRHDIEVAFAKCKHNLEEIYSNYEKNNSSIQISEDEIIWIKKYLKSIEIVDKNSSLFRYPFKDSFLQQYKNSFLDICEMGNLFLNAYAILDKEYTGREDKTIMTIDLTMNSDFLIFASNGFGNCYLWESPWGDGFHKQIIGYSKVAEFIYSKYDEDKDSSRLFPMLFLIRNAIELAVKRLLFVKVGNRVDTKIVRKSKNSHLLTELWNAVEPMLSYYANEHGEDINDLSLLKRYIQELNGFDKNGDAFRYPFDFNMTYRFNDKTIDINNAFKWMISIFNILDGCDYMLSDIADYESERAAEVMDETWW